MPDDFIEEVDYVFITKPFEPDLYELANEIGDLK